MAAGNSAFDLLVKRLLLLKRILTGDSPGLCSCDLRTLRLDVPCACRRTWLCHARLSKTRGVPPRERALDLRFLSESAVFDELVFTKWGAFPAPVTGASNDRQLPAAKHGAIRQPRGEYPVFAN
jgi:hypothetical protein